jgi:hypothetical protein
VLSVERTETAHHRAERPLRLSSVADRHVVPSLFVAIGNLFVRETNFSCRRTGCQ